MSNLLVNSLNQRAIESQNARKRKDEEIEALLSGGGGGGSLSNANRSNSDSDYSQSNSYFSDSSIPSMSAGNALLGMGAELAQSYLTGKVTDKIGEKIKDKLGKEVGDEIKDKVANEVTEKVGKEVAEEITEKVGKEVAEEVAEKAGKSLASKALGKLAGYGALMAGDGFLPIGDVIALGLMAKDAFDLVDAFSGGILSDGIKNIGDCLSKVNEDQGVSKDRQTADTAEDKAKLLDDTLNNEYSGLSEKEYTDKIKAENDALAKQKQKEKEARQQRDAERRSKLFGSPNKEDENQEEEEEDKEEENAEIPQESGGGSFLKKFSIKSLMSSLTTFGGSMAVGLGMIGMYRVHYTGEFEFKGISGEYQDVSYLMQNFTEYDENGDVVLTGLTKENKLVKTFYTYYSDKSYYVAVDDSEKYDDPNEAYLRKNLLTPEELKEEYPDIVDETNRAKMFQLNPDVLYSLDKYLHKDEVLYPQQLIKPVPYVEDKDDFELINLTDENGNINVESQKFGANGIPVKKDGKFQKTTGIWDYGFASVLHYKEFAVPRRKITVTTCGETVTNLPDRDPPAWMIDKAVTAGGTIENEIEQKWTRVSGSSSSSSDSTSSDSTSENSNSRILSRTLSNGMSDTDGSTSETEVEVCSLIEEYEEHYLPFYVGDPDTTKITGSKYYRDYLRHYENYLPSGLPSRIDFDVLENEEVAKLIYDDTPGSVNQTPQQGTENIVGQEFEAEFTAYSEPGGKTANGETFDASKNTCAAPIKRDYPNSLLSFNSRILIKDTGTEKDGTVCRINDVGGAIKLSSDGVYTIDIAMASDAEARKFGRRKGKIVIENSSTETVSTRAGRQISEFIEGAKTRTVQSRTSTSGLLLNTGGNAVTNYGMTMDDYARRRVPKSKCDSYNCTLDNYKKHIEPHAYKDEVGDLRHLRLDVYRPLNEQAVVSKFAQKFNSKVAPYAQSIINVAKEKNIDALFIIAQIGIESSNGNSAIIGEYNGKTCYNFTGVGAYDGNMKNGGLAYAYKKGWFSPELAVTGTIKFLAEDYVHSEKYKQNTPYKISMSPTHPESHCYATNPEYAYGLANYMRSWTDLYAPGTAFYFDFPEFDPNKPAGTIEGAGYVPGGGYSGSSGGGTPNSAFNQYLSQSWNSILENWDLMFEGQSELDERLAIEAKGDYTESYTRFNSRNSSSDKITRYGTKITSSINGVDEDIILNMMFALNQGNYLFKYDSMGEAEWKAMYTQLLSSPTGAVWDDKWIGFNKEDIFGTEDIGTLFKEDVVSNPTISKPYGDMRNIFSDDIEKLTRYNEINFGIDITIPPDTEVLAVYDGVVTNIHKKNDVNSRYGNYVEITHYNGITITHTSNLKSVSVKKGDKVKMGDVIGLSGGECKSYEKEDLHFEMRYKGEFINPTWIITKEMTGFEDPIAFNTNGVNCLGGGGGSTSATGIVQAIFEEGKKHLGKPWDMGAGGPDVFDCSHFINYIIRQVGIDAKYNTAFGLHGECQEVSLEQIQPGDLVFWHEQKGGGHSPISHVAMYVGVVDGEQKIIECASTKGVTISKLPIGTSSSGRYKYSYGRYAPVASASGTTITTSSGCQTPGQIPSNGQYLWPVPEYTDIGDEYGDLRDGGTRIHKGIDISASSGAKVLASYEGEVIRTNDTCPAIGYYGSKCGGGFGNYIYIKQPDGNTSIYPHLKPGSLKVKVGDKVTTGQEIGGVGTSGSSKGNHLHYEIKDENNKSFDPWKVLPKP